MKEFFVSSVLLCGRKNVEGVVIGKQYAMILLVNQEVCGVGELITFVLSKNLATIFVYGNKSGVLGIENIERGCLCAGPELRLL